MRGCCNWGRMNATTVRREFLDNVRWPLLGVLLEADQLQ